MKTILNIVRHDLKKVTSSVVAIIVIMGLCIVPCLYAWFNIFSNWAPYDQDATGRISVAVANEDKGTEVLGLSINIGSKIIDALEANKDIGWVFTDSGEEAIERVYASDYYAALVIPESFTRDALGFMHGDLTNPKLKYYENEKKNAIAPKITGKAKTAVQEQVNATFVETVAKYLSEGASAAQAGGLSPETAFTDLAERMEEVGDRLDDAVVMIDAAEGLSDAAGSLMDVSDSLIGDAGSTLRAQNDLLDTTRDAIPEKSEQFSSITQSVRSSSSKISSNLTKLSGELTDAGSDLETFNNFVRKDLESRKTLADEMQKTSGKMSKSLTSLGLTELAMRMSKVSSSLGKISDKLSELDKADETTWEDTQAILASIIEEADIAGELAGSVESDISDDIDKELQTALEDAEQAIRDMQNTIKDTDGSLKLLRNSLAGYGDALSGLEAGLADTRNVIVAMQEDFGMMSGFFSGLAGNKSISDVMDIMADHPEEVAAYLASPYKMETEVIYPVREYGSAMAPFYTVLAQWVGSLLTAVLIKIKVRRRKDLKPQLYIHEHFFGRYGLYLMVGLAQALIVSLGDLLYVGIQCLHPVRFVLAACVNGITFMMINYALVFALDNIGLGAGVIILVLQVAGSGGTYPVEVLPEIFQKLYPVMPFRYSMDAMRECICGMYGNTYNGCLIALGLFVLGSAALGMLLYRPALWLNNLIAESKKKSEIML